MSHFYFAGYQSKTTYRPAKIRFIPIQEPIILQEIPHFERFFNLRKTVFFFTPI